MIQNSHIEHDDDCVSFKPNSTNIVVQGLNCNSSHGISIGSLAQYPGVFDVVENLLIYNNTLHNATDSARIKIWVGEGAITNPGWIGGGGVGHVKNVTYEKFTVDNNDLAIQITQCYGASESTAESFNSLGEVSQWHNLRGSPVKNGADHISKSMPRNASTTPRP